MKWFAGIRALSLLRRIACALEQANELQRERFKYDYPAFRTKPKPRQAEISIPTVTSWNERYRKEREE